MIAHDPELGPVKWCPVCKEYWPADTEFFYQAKLRADGLHSYCIACHVEKRWPGGKARQKQTNIYSSWEYLLGLVVNKDGTKASNMLKG